MIDFMAEAQALRDELVARRRDFHMHPELGYEEVRTSGIVAKELNALGLEVQTGIGKTGVVGILEGDHPGPTVLVRADMDALPIHEENETDYASTVPGKMHACGHDGHTTIALGVAKLLSKRRDQINGRVKFVFQPAEEGGGGARAMIKDGVMESPSVDVALGLHLWNEMPLGKIGAAEGPVMSGASKFEIVVTGKGGHGAMPHQTVDPIVCAAHIITALQTIASRNTDPRDAAVITIGSVQAGVALNVIPQTATIGGTFRIFREEVRDIVNQRLTEISEGVATAMGCTADVDITYGIGPVMNHPDVATRIRGVFGKIVGEGNLIDERTMASEDVGLYMEDNPGMYFFVGSANDERGLNYPHHHPRFDFDEDVLPLGVALMSSAVADYLITG